MQGAVGAHGVAEALWFRVAVEADDEDVFSFSDVVGVGVGATCQNHVEFVESIDVAGVHAEKDQGFIDIDVYMFFPGSFIDVKR